MRRILRSLILIVFLSTLALSVILRTTWADSQGQTASGKIDSDVFSASVPQRMTIGETCNIILLVKNTGNTTEDFVAQLSFPFWTTFKYFYSSADAKNLTLSPGDSQRVEFNITAVDAHLGPLIVKANLYSFTSDQAELVDTVSSTVYGINTAPSAGIIIWISVLMILSAVGAFFIRIARKTDKRELLTVFGLLLVAFTLRAINLSVVAPYPDEATGLIESMNILSNGWKWPLQMMWMGYPPISHYLRAVSIYLFGFQVEPTRWVPVIAGSLTVVVMYYLGKSLFSKKTGALSAFLLCFSSFHILYSRLSETESLVLFFTLTSFYFFWRGYNEKSWKYMCASGIFMGLGLDTKYIVFALIPALVLFLIWVERSWKPLIKKNFLIWTGTVVLVILPVQLTLLLNQANPYYWLLDWMWGPSAMPQQVSRSLLEIIPRGIKIYVYWFARGGSPWLPWLPVYELALVALLLVAVLTHAYSFIKVRTRESFLVFSFLAPILFMAADPVRHTYGFIYSLPFLLIMFSNFTLQCARSLRIAKARSNGIVRRSKAFLNYLKFLAVVLASIVIISNTVIGIVAPVIDRGEIEGLRLAMSYISNHVRDGDSIAGWWGTLHMYYINQYDLNVTFVPLETITQETASTNTLPVVRLRDYQLNEQVLTTLKPRFIVIDRTRFDSYGPTIKEEFSKNYNVVWFGSPSLGYYWSDTLFQIWLVLERKSE